VDVRVLILDDCSTDDSEEVGRALAAADPRVEYRRHAVNRGHTATYNEGIDWLSGDYCLLLSADDMLTPGALSRAAAVMDAHPEVGLTYGQAVVTNRPDPARDLLTVSPAVEVYTGQEFVRRMCAEGYNIVQTPTAIGRTSVQRAIGGYRTDLPHSGDMEMWLRYATRSSVAYLWSHQAYYRTHAESMSVGYRGVKDLDEVLRAFNALFGAAGAELSSDLPALAHCRVADTAYARAWAAFERGDEAMCAAFTAFARSVCPGSRYQPKWLRLRCKRLLGSRLWAAVRRWRRAKGSGTARPAQSP
jgi:hypothetical protein